MFRQMPKKIVGALVVVAAVFAFQGFATKGSGQVRLSLAELDSIAGNACTLPCTTPATHCGQPDPSACYNANNSTSTCHLVTVDHITHPDDNAMHCTNTAPGPCPLTFHCGQRQDLSFCQYTGATVCMPTWRAPFNVDGSCK